LNYGLEENVSDEEVEERYEEAEMLTNFELHKRMSGG